MIRKLKHLLKMFKEHFSFSDDTSIYELMFIHPQLMVMVAFVNNYCYENSLELKITSLIRTPEENQRLGSVSRTHIEGRAADLSLKGFTLEQVKDLEHEINKRFADIGAISSSDGLPKPIVVHNNGHGYHAHLQIRPNI